MSRCGIGITVAVIAMAELMIIKTKYCLYPHDIQQEETFHWFYKVKRRRSYRQWQRV